MSFDAARSVSPLNLTGTFSLSAAQLAAAFKDALKPGHESELVLAFNLLFFFDALSDEQKAEVIARVFELVAITEPSTFEISDGPETLA